MTAGSIAFQAGENGSQILMAGELRIIATFVKLEATDTSPADNPYSLEEVISQVTANDEAMRDSVNEKAADELVANYEEGRSKVLNGLVKLVTTAVVTGIAIATGGAAVVVAAAVLGAASMLMTEAEIIEGIDQAENAQSGSLDKGYNVIRDGMLGGNDLAYNILHGAIDIAFGIVTGAAVGEFIGSLKGVQWLGNIIENPQTLKTVLQVTRNIGSVALRQYIDTGRLHFDELAAVGFTGFIQGQYGTSMRNWFVGKLGVSGCNIGTKIVTGITGTLVDTGIEGGIYNLFDVEFNPVESLARNGFANFLEAFTHDPVSVTTGAFILHATDAVIMSLPLSLKIERLYRSTDKKDSVFGRGFSFAYASRLYRDTKKEKECVHLETITGHSVCFEKEDGAWVNVSRGTGRFTLESRMEGIQTEEQTYLLNDAIEHTVCAYDSTGRLSCVEYPNSLRLVFTYGAEGLKRIATPLGNILEVECGGGHILQITDEIGRRTQYRYEGSYLVDVIHTDEGITHYEYDEYGYISSVTDQNGSRYLENTYDEKGRVVRQDFPDGVYQTFVYDSLHRRNTIYCSDSDRTEVYEYNDQMLIDRILYEDGTETAYGYSDDNLRNRETSRIGLVKTWEHDACGRIVREGHPDGYEAYSEYDVNDDLIHTWDSDGRECRYVYDNSHNRLTAQEKITDGQWKETSWEYDAKGRCVKEIDALGNETVKEYTEDCAYPVSVITPEGEETDNSYDRMGRRMSIRNSYGTVELSYNSRNFITKRTDGEGHTSCRLYDRMGNMTVYYPARQWEEQGDGWQYSYDYMERLVDTVSPSGTHRRSFVNFVGDPVRSIHPVSYALNGENGEGTRYEYDRDGNLTHIRYADGGVERRFYDADGRMVKQVLPESYDETTDDGEGTCYAYDGMDRITEVRDTDGNTLHTYAYNGNGQIIRETDGEGKETFYTYNDLGWKIRERISVRKEEDRVYYRVVAYLYDAQGNKVEERYGQQEVERDGEPESWHSIHFSYDKNNHLTLVQDDFGAQMRYDYDCLGNVILEERVIADGVRSIIHYAYNKSGWRIRKTEEIQGNGPVQTAVTVYSYDANGNLTKITTPKGFEIRRSYDADDRLTEERVIDRKSGIDRRVKYAYDAAGNILKRTILGTDGERLELNTRYDLKDRVTHWINSAGAVTRYLYDRNDNLLKEIMPYGYEQEIDDGAGTTYAYDSRGNRIRVTNALGELVQERSYNLQNRPVMQKDTFGNQTAFKYGLDGKIRDIRRLGDGNWSDSTGGAEAAGSMTQHAAVSQSARNGQRTIQQYRYNARGQIVGVVDGNQNKISYDVDSWGRITGVGFADGVKEGYEYTPAGQVCRTVDGNGNSVQYRYNSLGKVSERTDQLGYAETFQYDEEGNLSLHIDRDGRQLQRDCNVFGKPVYEKATDAEGKNPAIRTWHYDSLGRITRAVCDGHSYEYIYDAQGNLKEKRSSGKRLVSYAYDKAGQVTEIKDPAGVCTRYEYDILGRRSRIYNDEGLEVRYGYDALNRISRIRYGNGVETAYTYDGDGNISSLETKAGENILLSFAYQYDGNGNRTAKVGTQASAAMGGIISEITAGNNALDISYRYDVRGQLLEEQRNGAAVCYAYDRAGNRVKKTDSQGATIYQFNRKNQLIAEENPDGKNVFTYDRQGGIVEERNPVGIRRFSYNSRHQQTKVETGDGSIQENRYDAENLRFELLENGRKTGFVYHNGELLHEEGREDWKTSYHMGLGIDALQRGQELSYYHRDEQLSTAFITGSRGVIQNRYQYDAFGAELESVEQLSNRIRYTGQQYDGLTGQYYLRARYYNPVLGRFMQEDVYQGDGLNLYAYCGNNPVVYCDPSGYDKIRKCVQEYYAENNNSEESPALTTSPYNPDAVEQRIKPDYVPNPAHDSHSSSYNTHKTPEPIDAASVYNNAVRGGMGEWYGVNENGEIYQFFYDNDGGVHFAGIITKFELLNKNSSILSILGISPKGK